MISYASIIVLVAGLTIGLLLGLTGGALAQFLSASLLLLLFSAVMIVSGMAMVSKTPEATVNIALGQRPTERKWSRIVGDGFNVGIVTGLVGAGGGFLVVPALALFGGMPMHVAVGTSLLVVAMKCFAGLIGYVFVSHVGIDVDSAAIISVFAIGGTVVGAHLSRAVAAAYTSSAASEFWF